MTERTYKHRSLAQKLGIEKAQNPFVMRAPDNYAEEVGVPLTGSVQPYDFIHVFTTRAMQLDAEFPLLKSQLTPKGMLWVSWPKKGSEIETDLNENIIREIGISNGLVDVKVAAVDDSWSGLKFVYRLKDRKDDK